MGDWTCIRWHEKDAFSGLWGYAETGKYRIPDLSLMLVSGDDVDLIHRDRKRRNHNSFGFRATTPLSQARAIVDDIYDRTISVLKQDLSVFLLEANRRGVSARAAILQLRKVLEYFALCTSVDADSILGLKFLLQRLASVEPPAHRIEIDTSAVMAGWEYGTEEEILKRTIEVEERVALIRSIRHAYVAGDFQTAVSDIESPSFSPFLSNHESGRCDDWVFESEAHRMPESVGYAVLSDQTKSSFAEDERLTLIGEKPIYRTYKEFLEVKEEIRTGYKNCSNPYNGWGRLSPRPRDW